MCAPSFIPQFPPVYSLITARTHKRPRFIGREVGDYWLKLGVTVGVTNSGELSCFLCGVVCAVSKLRRTPYKESYSGVSKLRGMAPTLEKIHAVSRVRCIEMLGGHLSNMI